MSRHAALLLVVGFMVGGSATCSSLVGRPGIQVELIDIAGFNDEMPVWMPFRLKLGMTNTGTSGTTVRRIQVVPDIEGFNEAYGAGTPFDLVPTLYLKPRGMTVYQVAVTLLNANQLSEGTHSIRFNVEVETERGIVTFEFPAELDYFREPGRRALRMARKEE